MTTTDAMGAMLQGWTLDQRLQTGEGLRGRKAIEEEGTIPAACPQGRLRGTTRTTIDNKTIGEKERTLAVLLRGVRVITIEELQDNQRMRESRKRRRTSRSCFLEMTRSGIDKRVIREESRTPAV